MNRELTKARLVNGTKISLVQGNIVQQEVDAIVNAANSSLLGGGGVDGAIHRAGGPQILDECRKIRATQGGCAPGNAVITGAGKLPATHVIHTVGPVWNGGMHQEPETLANCYRRCLELAQQSRVRTVAFPSISTGAYRYPVEAAAIVAINAVVAYCNVYADVFSEVRFVLFDDTTLRAYQYALSEFRS